MRLIIEPDYASVSKWAAHYVASRINAAHPTEAKPFVSWDAPLDRHHWACTANSSSHE
jgi:hypothetical protein